MSKAKRLVAGLLFSWMSVVSRLLPLSTGSFGSKAAGQDVALRWSQPIQMAEATRMLEGYLVQSERIVLAAYERRMKR